MALRKKNKREIDNLSAEMVKQIRDYNKSIETIEDFVEIVRKTPGMYIGPLGTRGHINMVREIFQNSLDELVKVSSPCTDVWVTYDERTQETTVEDNGRGIPYESIIRIFTSQHTSSNYTKKDGEFSSGLHGVGSKVTNALSQWFKVQSYILGEGREVTFVDGKATDEDIKVIPNNGKQGTIVSFKPYYKTLGEVNTKVGDVLNLLLLILPLTKIGSPIHFTGIYTDGTIHKETFINQDGIITNLIMKSTKPLIAPIVVSKYTGKMTVDIAFTFDSEDLSAKDITAFANFCPTTEGTHIAGFLNSTMTFFRNYMNRIFLVNNKKNKVVINNLDVETGLKAIVSVKHLNPVFTGQAKEIFSNNDMKPFIEQVITEQLNLWVKETPKDLQKLCTHLKSIAEIRMKSEGEKVKLSSRYTASTFSNGLPKKYVKPTNTKGIEFIIFEGDSALEGARNARCDETQGLYPLKGKVPNVFTKTEKKCIENEDLAGVISIIGGGYGKKFNIEAVKGRIDKVIMATDSDQDGKHIRAGLLKFFLRYMTPLLEAGMVYSIIPPLYSIEKGIVKGKKTYTYLNNRIAYVMYVQKSFMKDNCVASPRGSVLDKNEITKILNDNMDYTSVLESVAGNYAIDPELFELILLNYNNIKTLERILYAKYRFMYKIEKLVDGTIFVKGLVNDEIQTVFLNNKLLSECNELFEYFNNNTSLYYKINNHDCTLYKLMKIFESYAPNRLQRYKGLGEMNASQLKESCVHPDSDRVLIQYTVTDVLEELDAITYLEANKSEFIKNVKVSKLDILG